MSRLVPLPFKRIRKILTSWGFSFQRSKGSHFVYRNEEGRMTVITNHGSKDIPVKTIKQIIKQTGIPKESFTNRKKIDPN